MATNNVFHKFITSSKKTVKAFSTDFMYIFIGSFIITPFFLLYFIITLPFIGYRAFITIILSKCYRTHHGYRNMVSPGFSTAYAIEYLSSVNDGQPSKNTILTRQVLEGHVPFEMCKEKLADRWLKAKDNNNRSKFPELSSYVESWMGYCYWKEDAHFDFNSHMHYHKTEMTQDVDQFTSNMFETLMNTPFMSKRSPWDVFVIHSWKQGSSTCGNNNSLATDSNSEITVIVTRTHHVLGDGKSILHLIFQELFGTSENIYQKQTSGVKVTQKPTSISQKLISVILTITKLMWDFGCIASFVLWRAESNTKLHVSGKQELTYFHNMSSLISMVTVKNVAKKFSVSFSGVLISSLASAISKSLDMVHVDKFLLAAPRPLPDHPTGRMVNYMTGAVYNIPISLEMHPIQRLMDCDKIFKMVNKSLFPTHVFPLLVHFLSYHIVPIAKFGFKGRHFSASFSNILGSPAEVCAFNNKYRVLEHSGACATYDGTTGLVVLISSYANGFRLHGVANSSVLSKQELDLFMELVLAEINDLHELESLPSEPSIVC